MGIFKLIKRWWESLFRKEAQEKFDVKTIESDTMHSALNEWAKIYQNKPSWANDDIESFNFAKKLCNETARLATLALGITIEGSSRADWLNEYMDKYISRMKNENFEKACAFGYIVLKPNGTAIDYVLPWDFVPTHATDGEIDGGIFTDYYQDGDTYYTRLEWHRYEDTRNDERVYRITNKAFKSDSKDVIGTECDLKNTIWADMEEDAAYINIEQPLFAILKMPLANNIDMNSPLGVSIFSNALKELKSLDIAWTRLEDEIFDSRKTVFLGDMLIDEPGKPVRSRYSANGVKDKTGKELPRYVHIIPGSNTGEEYHEINPVMQTDSRLDGIDHYLNLVGVKCGYSPGQFVLNGRAGQVTATQVESDDRETIQFIKQVRDSFQTATDALIYALDKMADIYNLAPVGTYEVNYDFGDITYNWEEDRLRHWQYVQSRKYPLYRYYMEFEGMSEEDARIVAEEAKNENKPEPGLFGAE